MTIYKNDYRQNLINYWRQWYPEWNIPNGYHVHHIKPKSTFNNPNDPKIHHPSNLIALHPDDHATVHSLRGDKFSASAMITSIKDRVISPETRKKISKSKTGIPAKKHLCRIFDKKEMTLKGFTRWSKFLDDPIYAQKVRSRHRKALKETEVFVCRIFDRKVIPYRNFVQWCKSKDNPVYAKRCRNKQSEALKNNKLVCRIHDRKEMDMGNFVKWCKFQDDPEYSKTVRKKQSNSHKDKHDVCRIFDKKVMNNTCYKRWEKKYRKI